MQVSVSISEVSIVSEEIIQARMEQKIKKLQRELELLQGGLLQYYRRQCIKYQKWYIRLALSGKYTESQLNKLYNKVEHYRYEIVELLDMEPYDEEYKTVCIGIKSDNKKFADCTDSSRCNNCAAVCFHNEDPHMRTL